MSEPCELGAVEAVELIRSGRLVPTELVSSCLERIDEIDHSINAMVVRDDEAAMEAAKAADAALSGAKGKELGALYGLPVAIKDIQDAAGLATTFGAIPFADNLATSDDPLVARLRAAGAIVIGKTNTPELSIGANTTNRLHGATTNPFDIERTCGGSSGGSAAALACSMTTLATGSDHGGSLRIPASYCGVVGHRSTPGTVPYEARTITQTNYSVQGPMGKCVADAALMMTVIARRDETSRRDPMAFPLSDQQLDEFADIANGTASVDLSQLRVRTSYDLGGLRVDQVVREAFAEKMRQLEPHIASLEPSQLDLTDGPEIDWHLRADVFATQYHRSIHKFDEGFNSNVRDTYETALRVSVIDIARARRRQAELFAATNAEFDSCDVLICPAVAVPPFDWHQHYPLSIDGVEVENYMSWLSLTSSLTVVGHPVTVIASGLDSLGLPFGLQVVGPAYSDAATMAVAAALEACFGEDDLTQRPLPDIASLAAASSECRTEGKLVAESTGKVAALAQEKK